VVSSSITDKQYLEILPSFWPSSSYEENYWYAASTELWCGSRPESTQEADSIDEMTMSDQESIDFWNRSPRKMEKLAILDMGNIGFYDSGRTELSYAAGEGLINSGERLVPESAILVRMPDEHGRCPLSWAAGNGHNNIAHFLLNTRKFNVNAKDKSDQTPL